MGYRFSCSLIRARILKVNCLRKYVAHFPLIRSGRTHTSHRGMKTWNIFPLGYLEQYLCQMGFEQPSWLGKQAVSCGVRLPNLSSGVHQFHSVFLDVSSRGDSSSWHWYWLPLKNAEHCRPIEFVTEQQEKLREAFSLVREHLRSAAESRKVSNNMRTQPCHFEPGKWVLCLILRRRRIEVPNGLDSTKDHS